MLMNDVVLIAVHYGINNDGLSAHNVFGIHPRIFKIPPFHEGYNPLLFSITTKLMFTYRVSPNTSNETQYQERIRALKFH
jgi:hypothetical protein